MKFFIVILAGLLLSGLVSCGGGGGGGGSTTPPAISDTTLATYDGTSVAVASTGADGRVVITSGGIHLTTYF